ncbi:MAG TPA: efflux RND transporter permease subunit [Candidatus Enterocloster faecavium]|uniref:Efflux RND transporter permease subunit n=1 Tax=Candidatus Enterocloster faecavium TaxID=2838560 RepID=A0A9D2L955_9FIRM|nr:efflux RND transporter permease subunit [Candidatus Enterocloster faecavium]
MVQLTKLALKRPVTIIMCLLTIVYFGFQSVMGAKVELTPEMELPMLLISTVYAGASPEDISELITTKQEDAIASLSGVDTVQSYSMENASIIMIQYEYGTNMDTAYIDLKKAIDAVQDMPEDADEPTIMELDINSAPVVTLAVSGDTEENLYTYVENNIVPEFEKLSSVGQVSLSGGQESYVRVQLDPQKMDQYHLTMEAVAQIIGAADFTIPVGNVTMGDLELSASADNSYDDVASLETIPIPVSGGNTIHLSDVAQVYETTESVDSIGRYNGEDVISMGIQKQQSSTAIETSDEVMSEIESLAVTNPEIHFTVINDSSEMIEDSVSDVYQTVVMAVVLAMIVLWLFCGDLKASVIIGASLISSVVLALIAMSAMGFSMNVISLTSLVFGVGMMVDNSINVLDGCFRAKEHLNYYDAALKGAKDMVGAIAGGTATNCVVFIPLLLLEGLTGQLFTQLAWTVIFCLVASLFSASMLVPLCFYMWHPQERENAPINGLMKGMQNWYRKHMPNIVPKTKTIFAVTIILFVVSLAMGSTLKTELMPASDEGIVDISIAVKPGLKVEKVNEVVAPVEQMVAQDEDLDYYLLTYGSSGMSLGGGSSVSITAYLKDDRKLSTNQVIDKWLSEAAYLPDITVSMESGSSTGTSMSSTRQIEVDLQGTDYDAVQAESSRLVEALRDRDDVSQVHSSIENAAPVLKIHVDPVKAQAEGLTPASIGGTIYNRLSGVTATTMRVNNEDIDVVVEYPEGQYDTVDQIQGMLLTTGSGTQIPLASLADVYYEDSPSQIVRKDKRYQVSITMEPNIGYEDTADADVKSFVAGWEFQDGVGMAVNALDESTAEEIGALGQALVTAIFLIFIAMAIQFESPKYSLMIMITIPFSLIGAFGLLFLFDSSISMTSMLGFLMMVGNVVNGGILYVETVNQYREEMPLDKALVEAGATRLRPILMTVTITVISEIPNVFAYGGETMQGSSLVNVGGLLASTALMLLMMPTFYRVVHNMGLKHLSDPQVD